MRLRCIVSSEVYNSNSCGNLLNFTLGDLGTFVMPLMVRLRCSWEVRLCTSIHLYARVVVL